MSRIAWGAVIERAREIVESYDTSVFESALAREGADRAALRAAAGALR